LHGLVNNAGIYQPRTLMETETELFERHTRVNQLGCFLGMKAVVSLMEQSGGGRSSIYHRLPASADPQVRSPTALRNGR